MGGIFIEDKINTHRHCERGGAIQYRTCRRLKPTVNRVLSLRDNTGALHIPPCRHCERSEAIQRACMHLDCFAALAMTRPLCEGLPLSRRDSTLLTVCFSLRCKEATALPPLPSPLLSTGNRHSERSEESLNDTANPNRVQNPVRVTTISPCSGYIINGRLRRMPVLAILGENKPAGAPFLHSTRWNLPFPRRSSAPPGGKPHRRSDYTFHQVEFTNSPSVGFSTRWKTSPTLRLDIPPGGIYQFPAGGVFHLVERSDGAPVLHSTKWNGAHTRLDCFAALPMTQQNPNRVPNPVRVRNTVIPDVSHHKIIFNFQLSTFN